MLNLLLKTADNNPDRQIREIVHIQIHMNDIKGNKTFDKINLLE